MKKQITHSTTKRRFLIIKYIQMGDKKNIYIYIVMQDKKNSCECLTKFVLLRRIVLKINNINFIVIILQRYKKF